VGGRERSGQPLVDTLAEQLGGRRLLVVVDNCEHLVAACAQLVAGLVSACPRLQVLATSRVPLAVEGEATFEVTGTEASLAVPDPNTFAGPLMVRKRGEEWVELPVTGAANGRGIGVVDLARALRANVPHRATGDLAQHVLELMTAIEAAGAGDRYVSIDSTVDRPEPLPADWDPRIAIG
jgi:predicted dehydrogenase